MAETLRRNGSGDPLVLLHGLTGSWHVWKPVLPALEASYDVVALTLPGHLGWPLPKGAELTVDGAVELVIERLAELGITDPHLAGNSLGGWVALELAARGHARSVTAFSPAGGWGEGEERTPRLFQKMRATVEEAFPAAAAFLASPEDRREVMGLVLERGDLVPPDEAIRMWEAVLAVQGLDRFLDRFARTAPELPSLGPTPPQSIVWCGEDHLLTHPEYSQRWREAAPHAVWTILESAGHVPMYDDPEGVVRQIKETVARAS